MSFPLQTNNVNTDAAHTSLPLVIISQQRKLLANIGDFRWVHNSLSFWPFLICVSNFEHDLSVLHHPKHVVRPTKYKFNIQTSKIIKKENSLLLKLFEILIQNSRWFKSYNSVQKQPIATIKNSGV